MTFKSSIIKVGFAMAVSMAAITTAAPVYAQAAEVTAAAELTNQTFFKKKYKVKGTWSLVERDGMNYVKFSDDFKTKNGPDLKIFLSPKSAADVNGKNATEGALNLGALTKNKGTQEYAIPAGTDLSNFSTVLIHCEAYAILWGGGSL